MDTITRAHQRAQRRFHRMIVAACYGDPTDRRTRLYSEAERLLDRLTATPEWLLDAQHDAVQAEMDELAQAEADRLPDVPLAAWTEAEARWAWGNR